MDFVKIITTLGAPIFLVGRLLGGVWSVVIGLVLMPFIPSLFGFSGAVNDDKTKQILFFVGSLAIGVFIARLATRK